MSISFPLLLLESEDLYEEMGTWEIQGCKQLNRDIEASLEETINVNKGGKKKLIKIHRKKCFQI